MIQGFRQLWASAIAVGVVLIFVLTILAAGSLGHHAPQVDINDLSFYQPPINTEHYPLTTATKVRNVIFRIGDGMGLSQVTLALMTRKAIRCLRNAGGPEPRTKNGFFLMVEGSQIDWACHSNDAESRVRQTLLFDEAVKVAIDFALADGRTLVIVTADHETGGLTIPDGSLAGTDAKVKWSTKGHTGTPVPVFALGPNAEQFAGMYDNTEITRRLAPMLGLRPWPQPMK